MKNLLLAALISASSLFAHEFIVKPGQCDAQAGQKVPFNVMVAHRFMVSEEVEDSSYVDITLYQNGKKSEESELTVNESFLTLDGVVTPKKKGAALIVGHRRAMAWSKTTQGWKVGNKETLKGVIESNLYEKFAKVLLVVDGDDTGYDAVIGNRLEIVPLSSPDKARAGDEVSFKVLFDGKPLASEVKAGYDGFSRGNNTYAFAGNTDENGVITVPFDSKGLWMIRVDHTVTPEDEKKYGKHNMRAVYIFEIR